MYINEVKTLRELAFLLQIEYNYLTYILYKKRPENCYVSFVIPKKSGENRTINSPIKSLKYIQRKLTNQIWRYELYLREEKGIDSKISHAFEKNKSIFTNANIHKGKKYIINTDLKDYFDSFHFGRVRGYFNKNNDYNLPIEIATIIAQLTCYNSRLPQGAPSSPIITNLISNNMDMMLLNITKKYKLDYTRYADDLTFSTNDKYIVDNFDVFLEAVSKIVEKNGFELNTKKTRLQYKDSRQVVTGLVVNEKLNISSDYFRETKAMAFSLYTKGKFNIGSKEGTMSQLEGRFSFINQIDKYNNKLEKKPRSFRNLNKREEQFRRFLFYKYFYHNNKPLIVTEGKTDIIYIKAALKKLYMDYPDLVKKEYNSFDYGFAFLKRSKTLEFLFGFAKDGADSMKNLYNFFTGNNNAKDYLKYFQEYSMYKPNYPVVFLFDNELIVDSKPLSGFIKHIKLDDNKQKYFKENHFVRVLDGSNLFLVTIPLVKNKAECEIEDLFDDSVLELTLNGKTFDRKGKNKNNQHFGKEIFSKYIMKHYKEINFDRFKPFLVILQTILNDYEKNG